MGIDDIIKKGKEGTLLTKNEIEKLMLHAIDLLKFIELTTLESIKRNELIISMK